MPNLENYPIGKAGDDPFGKLPSRDGVPERNVGTIRIGNSEYAVFTSDSGEDPQLSSIEASVLAILDELSLSPNLNLDDWEFTKETVTTRQGVTRAHSQAALYESAFRRSAAKCDDVAMRFLLRGKRKPPVPPPAISPFTLIEKYDMDETKLAELALEPVKVAESKGVGWSFHPFSLIPTDEESKKADRQNQLIIEGLLKGEYSIETISQAGGHGGIQRARLRDGRGPSFILKPFESHEFMGVALYKQSGKPALRDAVVTYYGVVEYEGRLFTVMEDLGAGFDLKPSGGSAIAKKFKEYNSLFNQSSSEKSTGILSQWTVKMVREGKPKGPRTQRRQAKDAEQAEFLFQANKELALKYLPKWQRRVLPSKANKKGTPNRPPKGLRKKLRDAPGKYCRRQAFRYSKRILKDQLIEKNFTAKQAIQAIKELNQLKEAIEGADFVTMGSSYYLTLPKPGDEEGKCLVRVIDTPYHLVNPEKELSGRLENNSFIKQKENGKGPRREFALYKEMHATALDAMIEVLQEIKQPPTPAAIYNESRKGEAAIPGVTLTEEGLLDTVARDEVENWSEEQFHAVVATVEQTVQQALNNPADEKKMRSAKAVVELFKEILPSLTGHRFEQALLILWQPLLERALGAPTALMDDLIWPIQQQFEGYATHTLEMKSDPARQFITRSLLHNSVETYSALVIKKGPIAKFWKQREKAMKSAIPAGVALLAEQTPPRDSIESRVRAMNPEEKKSSDGWL